MNSTRRNLSYLFPALFAMSLSALAADQETNKPNVAEQAPKNIVQANADADLHAWEVRRLTHPTPLELRDEQSGKVYIYDDLTDREVDQALDNNFQRIESMMFVGTVKTDEQGDPVINSATGQPMQESGGCDN
ncbi:MAG: hypothetical protein WBX11_17790 [Thiobacillaceae bacterium]